MKRITFTLQGTPDYIMELDCDFRPNIDDEYTVKEEDALALIIYNRFPELKKSHRRIKKLTIVDEEGKTYVTEDFDFPGNIKKI